MVCNNANFNYIIIGAGASGCIMANRLSADPAVKVLLLEAGCMDSNLEITDINSFTKLWGSDMDWKLKTVPQKNMFNREVVINQGKIIGGSSAIDAMVYERGNAVNYDDWAAMGANGWAYNDVLPYFNKLENQYNNGAYSETESGVSNYNLDDDRHASSVFVKAAKQAGFKVSNLHNGNAGNTDFAKDRKYESSATAFLHPVMHRLNLDVVTNACVKRVIIDSGTATGVEYVIDGVTFTAKAINEVILSAGALASPKILMLSGIGPANDLLQLGIDVVHDLPGVGRNLQDYLQLPVIFRTETPMPGLPALAGNIMFAKTQYSLTAPDIRISFNPGKPSPIMNKLPDFGVPVCVFLASLVQPASRGSVRLASNNYRDAPIIDPGYLEADTDMAAFKKAIDIIKNITEQPAFGHLNICELIPGAANVESFIRSVATTAWHPAGTCKMGIDRLAVVDEELRVKGIRNLRVADASVMPVITSGNPVATCLMIGEKASGMIIEKMVRIDSEIDIAQL